MELSQGRQGGVDYRQSLLDGDEFESFDIEFDMSVVSDPKSTLEGYAEYHEQLCQAKRRELYLWDDVSASSVASLYDMIMAYNRKDKDKSIEERKPIYLHIFSSGGDVFSGNALLDSILQSKTTDCELAIALVLIVLVDGFKFILTVIIFNPFVREYDGFTKCHANGIMQLSLIRERKMSEKDKLDKLIDLAQSMNTELHGIASIMGIFLVAFIIGIILLLCI